MAISFNAIPIDLRVPGQYVEIDNSRAVQGLPGMPSRLLVLGQMSEDGSATALAPVEVLTAEQAAGLFGRGSMLHRMVSVLKAVNKWTRLTVIPLQDDTEGAAATGSITVTGPATASGTIALMVGGQRVRLGVTAGQTAAQMAAAMVAKLAAALDLPVVAAIDGSNTAKVNLTARHKGEAGNFIDLRHSYYTGEALPGGVGLTLAAMSGGSGNPDLAGAIAAMGDEWYTDIVLPYTDAASLDAIDDEMARRFGPLVMQDAHAYAMASGTHAALTTLGESRNGPHVSILGLAGSPTPPWEGAAVLGGVAAYYSHIDPARPLQTLALSGILAPAEVLRFTLEERNLLLYAGIATAMVADDGSVAIERCVTTYRENAYGLEDASYLDVETLKTLAYLRYTVRSRIAARFPRHKLASDGTNYGPGQAIVTPSVIRAELVALFHDWETAGLVEGFEQFNEDLIVERDGSDPNRVNALIPPDVVNGLRVFAGLVQFRL